MLPIRHANASSGIAIAGTAQALQDTDERRAGMNGVSRREFLGAGAGSVIALVPVPADSSRKEPSAKDGKAAGATGRAENATTFLFFNADEAAFINAAVDRLIPPDAIGPGAVEAAVPYYIDRQLHGAWGSGERLYRAGPWQQGAPTQGYQMPFTPAELFRTAMRAIRTQLMAERNQPFEKLDGEAQDTYLTRLQTTSTDLAGVPSNVFFESLLGMTVEGYFCDPVYGGNKDMAAWKMIGFPGAHANYYHLIDKHNIVFASAPRSLAQDASGHVHVMPEIPASGGAMPHMHHGQGRR
jgi:gluconate 2-dehydrogenase gamma chain